MVPVSYTHLLYAWFNIAANWDPYGNTGELKVAVVNEDEGLDIESMDLPDTAKKDVYKRQAYERT